MDGPSLHKRMARRARATAFPYKERGAKVVPTRASALGLCFLGGGNTGPRISNGACAWEKVDDTWILTIICRRAPRQSPVLWH